MRTLRLIIVALLVGVGLTALAGPAEASINSNLYSFRSCAKYERFVGGRTVDVCLKTYVRRQSDGQGWRLNSVHLYAWTEGEGLGPCGTGFNSPTAVSSEVVTYGSDDNRGWYMDSPMADLDDPNGCDRMWGSDPGVFISFGGDHFTVNYFERAHLAFMEDPGLDKLHQRFEYNNSGGINWFCEANTCDIDGPF